MPRFSWIITLPLTVAVVVFAVANRQAVSVSLWPFPLELELPLYLVGLVLLGIGLICGAIIGWLAAMPARTRARRERLRADRLALQLDQTRQAPATPGLPAGRVPAGR